MTHPRPQHDRSSEDQRPAGTPGRLPTWLSGPGNAHARRTGMTDAAHAITEDCHGED